MDEFKTTSSGPNVYRVMKDVERHVLLECVWFSEKEDLGDGIFCTAENQQIWIARYFFEHFHKIDT
jgi:hypothetical protein